MVSTKFLNAGYGLPYSMKYAALSWNELSMMSRDALPVNSISGQMLIRPFMFLISLDSKTTSPPNSRKMTSDHWSLVQLSKVLSLNSQSTLLMPLLSPP